MSLPEQMFLRSLWEGQPAALASPSRRATPSNHVLSLSHGLSHSCLWLLSNPNTSYTLR